MTDALDRLELALAATGPLCIAVSGGVDSMTLAHVAHGIVGGEMVHAISPAVPPDATNRVRRHADRHGWTLRIVRAGEFDDPQYISNPVNRCFFCKTNLYQRIAGLTALQIASGANTDDLGDYRPGLLAAKDHRILHPMVEAGLDKAQVRAVARLLGLDDLAELPAQPCLASRVETGIPIDPGDMLFIDGVESQIRREVHAGITVRCRVLRDGVALEIDSTDPDLLDRLAALVEAAAQEAGRQFAGVRAYRRGSAFVGKPVSSP